VQRSIVAVYTQTQVSLLVPAVVSTACSCLGIDQLQHTLSIQMRTWMSKDGNLKISFSAR
jgi:hypothetical protein